MKNKSQSTQKQMAGWVDNLLRIISSNQWSDRRIALHLLKEIQFVRPDDIIRCEAANSYTWCYMANGEKFMLSRGIGEFENQLTSQGFIRCHQSHLVNRLFVRSLVSEGRKHKMVMTNKERIPVSRLKKAMVEHTLTTL
jgi:two-component system LytT family response regulator